MAELDRGAKIVLQQFPEDLLRLLYPAVRPGDPIGTEAVSAQIVSDRAFVGEGPAGEVVLHLEFEAEPTSDVGYRATRTACGLFFAVGRPVQTSIIYLHPAADGRRPKNSYTLPVGLEPAQLTFRTLVLWEDLVAAEIVDQAAPGLLPFAGLAAGASLETIRAAVLAIEGLSLPESQRADLQAALCLLSGYHFTPEELLGIMSEETLMKSKTYLYAVEKGREEGREEGRRELLLELLRSRLGELGELEGRVEQASSRAVAEAVRLVGRSTPEEDLRGQLDRLLQDDRTLSGG